KSGGTDQQLLLANGSTKPLSDFIDSIDSQQFVDKSTDQTIGGNKVFSLEVRAPTFKLPGYSSDYVVMSGAMKNKSHFVLTDEVDQTVSGTKTFSNNITAPAFVKSDGTDQQVLLANGSTKAISEFASGSVDDSNFVKKTGQETQSIEGKLIRSGSMESFNGANLSEYLTKDQIVGGCVLTNGGGNVSGNIEASGNITSASFVKSGGTNQQVLMANGSTKPLAEFSGGGGDMTNYVQKNGQTLQVVNGTLRKGDGEEESESEDEDYMTKG
ncbi:MAG: hypothetical protein EZS28_053135, partial [Streblomastix strix]